MSASTTVPAASPPRRIDRWIQLFFGIVCMAMVANLQYGWTLFVNPMDAKFQWGRAAIQVAFSIFVITETWLVPIEGYLVDRFGPRPVVLAGGVLVAVAWVMNSYAESLAFLYIAAAMNAVAAVMALGLLKPMRIRQARVDAKTFEPVPPVSLAFSGASLA